ncbi:MAG: hypothetical protein ACM3SV_07865, partial [Betaproteobacteria bacterium]
SGHGHRLPVRQRRRRKESGRRSRRILAGEGAVGSGEPDRFSQDVLASSILLSEKNTPITTRTATPRIGESQCHYPEKAIQMCVIVQSHAGDREIIIPIDGRRDVSVSWLVGGRR